MLIIGENIQIISPIVRRALDERDPKPLQRRAKLQVEHGAQMLDLNIGRRKKDGHEVMPWLVDVVHEVVPDVGLSLDTTNPAAMEAGLKRCQELGIEAMVNSTSAEEERLSTIAPLAAKYNAKIIALTMTKAGIPIENIYFDPLVLTVSGTQHFVPHAIEALRYLKVAADPPPKTVVGLSNVSSGVPQENRSLINRTYLVMLMAAGLDAAIVNPLDEKQNEVIRIVEERDTSTPVGRLLVALYDATAAMEELDPSLVDMDDPEQVAIWKTVQILMNKVIYADGYLRM